MSLSDLLPELVVEITHEISDDVFRANRKIEENNMLLTINKYRTTVINIRQWSLVCKRIKTIVDSMWWNIRRYIWNVASSIHRGRLPNIFDDLNIPRYHELAIILYFMKPKQGTIAIKCVKDHSEKQRLPRNIYPENFLISTINTYEKSHLHIHRETVLFLSLDGKTLVYDPANPQGYNNILEPYDSYRINIVKYRGQGLRRISTYDPLWQDLPAAFEDAKKMKQIYLAIRKEIKQLQGDRVRKS